ncbi:capsule biosynthesis protein [Sabulicella rubraurantiaca]|uniref:capsule biosynthesis protein n=1 Tax=Sabulicella rubraurantiaca TaxID=2811429 RepID=UPI001A976DD5|nr:capsular biosynthesis protein [Sabulicella rubraurantiaca]
MRRSFLFLQGPTSPFFRELGAALAARGHAVRRINLCLGDRLFWKDERSEDFTGRAEDWLHFLEARLEGVTDLVLLGEQRPLHRAAIEAAHSRGIAVTVTDFGYLRPDWIVLERDGMNALSRYPRDRAGILALAAEAPPLDTALRHPGRFSLLARGDMAFHLASALPWPFPHWRSFAVHSPFLAYPATGLRLLLRSREARLAREFVESIPAEAPVFLFAMQMETDYSIRAYSPFPDMDTPLRAAIRSFVREALAEARLLVKPHPYDAGLKSWRARVSAMARDEGVETRVALVDGIPLDPLLERAAGLVTVNSTTGIRALQLGRPVLALGQALWDVEGLAHRGGLDSFWAAPQAPDPVLADAFLRGIAHHLHIRGDYYEPSGRRAAVAAAVERLEQGAGPPEVATPPRPRLVASVTPQAAAADPATRARAPG